MAAFEGGTPDWKQINKTARKFEKFKEFLANECYDLKKYKAGKYDRKIFNWFNNLCKKD